MYDLFLKWSKCALNLFYYILFFWYSCMKYFDKKCFIILLLFVLKYVIVVKRQECVAGKTNMCLQQRHKKCACSKETNNLCKLVTLMN